MSLQIEGLCVDLDGRRIVTDVDLKVPDGSFACLLGPNGSGKSTILKAMYRGLRPSRGRVLLDGEDLLALPPRQAARRVAVVQQETVLDFDFTVLEMVTIGRTPHKGAFAREDEADRLAVGQAMARVGCDHLATRSFNALSGGEKQRVLIARALAQGARHLVLDEPTNHLDVRYQLEVLELVARLGLTVLAAMHDLALAALFCDRVYLVTGGRVTAHGSPDAVITAEMVRQAYGADVRIIEHPDSGTPHPIPRRPL